MKKTTRLLMCAVLLAGMLPQVASAVLYTNKVKNIQAMNVRATIQAATCIASGEIYNPTNGAIRNQYTVAAGGQTGKAWVQFNLSNAWTLYGQANLASANLTLWNQNGTTRRFQVAGIADGAGLEGWTASALTWSNAPANELSNVNTIGYSWDFTKCYGGTNIWDNLGTGGIDCSTPQNTQGAYYVSTNATSKVLEFLQSDTDGLVTCSISDGPVNLNQTIPIGTNGVYDGQLLAANGSGVPTRDSPTLTMVFDVRVALVGGGQYCGTPLDISMAGTDVGVDYLLYTNGVYTGQTVAGNGTNVSFGPQTAVGTYTAIASNTTTTVTTPVFGDSVIIFSPTTPSITVQPVSFVGATNSVGLFNVTATGDISSYAWYRNGVALTDDGHYSGTATAQLMISPVLASDAATTTDGYYCVIANVCGWSVTTTTNALTIQVARDLVWQGTPSNTWNIDITANWTNSAGAAVTFLQGDNVILDDTALNTTVAPASPYLSPGNITFNHSAQMYINGPGKISGPNSKLIVNGTTSYSELFMNSANDIRNVVLSNGWLYLGVYNGIGERTNTTITLAGTGASWLEIGTASGIQGVIDVKENSTLHLPINGANVLVFNGQLIGTAGKKLTINAPNASPGTNARFYGTFTCDCDIDLNINGANLAPYQSGVTIFNGVISGNGRLYPRQDGPTILNGSNTFIQTIISQGNVGVGIDSDLYGASPYSPLGLGTILQDNQGDNGILAWGGARTIENPFTWIYRANANRYFVTLGTNQLTMSGAIDLSGGTNNVVRTFRIDNTAPTILSGVISDAGQNMGINKIGNGTLLLNNVNTYTGPTTVSAGTLGGTGTIAGPVTVSATGTLAPGASIGTLTINNSLTVSNGTLAIEVNKSVSPSNDVLQVSGTLSAVGGAGKVTVTNLGPALSAGDRFVLFPGNAMTGGSALTITGAGMIWTNKLAVDGSIEVVAATATYATNITCSVSGTNLNLSWPATHIGWTLQRQINSRSVGLSTNWTTVAGYEAVNSASIPINTTSDAVFYRLFYTP